ncbi:MAG: Gfo/Idh/MocA family oxidoreductase [Clostridia bacterium]|nr:Gfo/Idh/MocA family oxidoreductase [Clostridia bacterium]
MKQLKVLFVAVGGHGGTNAREVLEHGKEHNMIIEGVVDPFIEKAALRDRIYEENIPVYNTVSEFYKEHSADLAIISTPIHMHADMSIECMENGSDVLCEKPVAPTLQEAGRMLEAEKRTGRRLSIGYQLSFAGATLKLKDDIQSGLFGKPVSMYAALWWPRSSAYYARPWAAKKYMDGKYVLDSIAMNACAHYLHNMLFLLGDSRHEAAKPDSMDALLCRGNDIEMYDTAFMRVRAKGIDLKFAATHVSKVNKGPVCRYIFEKAVVEMSHLNNDGLAITAHFTDGTEKKYESTNMDTPRKIWHAAEMLRGETGPVCTAETSMSHLICINAASEFVPVKVLDKAVRDGDFMVMPGIDRVMEEAFEKDVMPWELSDEFGSPVHVDLTDYRAFGGVYDEKQ